MNKLAALAFFALAAAPAAAAPTLQRNYSVTDFDRVRVDGPFKVELATSVAPFARASGTVAALDAVLIAVEGRTLVIKPNRSSWSGYPGQVPGPVAISVGTHDLSAAYVNGSGLLSVDRVKGLSFEITVQGAGSASVDEAAIDQLKLGISGSGTLRLAGTAGVMTALVRGTPSFDGSALRVKDARIGADGAPMIRALVSNSAKIDASGVATVEIAGNPACTVTAKGSATVSGCRKSD